MKPVKILLIGAAYLVPLVVLVEIYPRNNSSSGKNHFPTPSSSSGSVMLSCSYSGKGYKLGAVRTVDKSDVLFAFNEQEGTVLIPADSHTKFAAADFTSEWIIFDTTRSDTYSTAGLQVIISSHYRISRETLRYSEWGEVQFYGNSTPFSTWRYDGKCETVESSTEEKKV